MDMLEPGPFRLVVAAEAREFRGILRNCGVVNELKWPIAVSLAVELLGVRYVLAANGPGPRLANSVLKAAEVEAGKAGIEIVISTGFCGGLDPQLQLGDIVEATSVIDLATGRQYDARPIGTSFPHFRGLVLSEDRVAVTIEEKTRLRNRVAPAAAIEMEAAAVGSWADVKSIPMYCVRVVSDTAHDAFPFDANRMRDEEGRFSRMKIVGQALRSPRATLPGLMKLDRDCRKAEERLGEFFANCRFE